MTLTELAARANITIANLSILKNERARAIRFSTLTTLCEILDCQPGDLLSFSTERSQGQERNQRGGPGHQAAVPALRRVLRALAAAGCGCDYDCARSPCRRGTSRAPGSSPPACLPQAVPGPAGVALLPAGVVRR